MSGRTMVMAGVALVVAITAGAFLLWPNSSDTPSDTGTAASPSVKPEVVATPPTDGEIEETVAPSPRGAVIEAGSDDRAELPDGVVVSLLDAERRTVTPGGPGDVAGEALVVEIEIENATKSPVDLDTVMVTVTDNRNQVAQPLTAEPYDPFRGPLAPGEVDRSSYVFATGSESPTSFVMLVEYVAGSGIARFTNLGSL